MKVIQIEIPRTAFVPCPKRQFTNVRVAEHCPGCEFFRGLMKVAEMPPASFTQGARIACAHPVTRTMIHVEA